MLKKILMALVGLVILAVLAVGGIVLWAKSAVKGRLAETFETHRVELAVPMPLTDAEIEAIVQERLAALPEDDKPAEGEDPPEVLEEGEVEKIALERALERGKHLVEARFVCIECHGKDFGGGVMVDDPAMGAWLGPNITEGAGSRTVAYTTTDWDRIVRHGVKPDGTPAIMPSDDFVDMSDQELSDIIAYIRTFPPKEAEVARPTFGPIGMMLMATGQLPLSAEHIHDHQRDHGAVPPAAEPTPTFGKHLAQICTGCHRKELNGGPIAAGPPDWPPARNLTPHAEGLEGWTYDQFVTAMVEGKRPDGSDLLLPMSLITPYAKNMTEVELQALFAYVQSLPELPTGT